MSWISDGLANIGRTGWGAVRDYAQFANGLVNNPIASGIQQFAQGMYDKSDLRGAQVESVLSGFPILGNFLKGINGVQQLEDLYNNTGKVPEYPSLSTGSNSSGIGKGVGALSRKIEAGAHDLYEFYSGEKATELENYNKSVSSAMNLYGDTS